MALYTRPCPMRANMHIRYGRRMEQPIRGHGERSKENRLLRL